MLQSCSAVTLKRSLLLLFFMTENVCLLLFDMTILRWHFRTAMEKVKNFAFFFGRVCSVHVRNAFVQTVVKQNNTTVQAPPVRRIEQVCFCHVQMRNWINDFQNVFVFNWRNGKSAGLTNNSAKRPKQRNKQVCLFVRVPRFAFIHSLQISAFWQWNFQRPFTKQNDEACWKSKLHFQRNETSGQKCPLASLNQ